MRIVQWSLSLLAVALVVTTVIFAISGSTATGLIVGISAGWIVCLATITWDLRIGISLTALVAAGVSAYLANQHLEIQFGAVSICAVNEVFDCDKVNASKWAELFGIANSIYGFGFYIAIAVGAAIHRLTIKAVNGVPKLIALSGVFAALYGSFLAIASHSMGVWCLFCIATYGLNLMLLISGIYLAIKTKDQSSWFDIILFKERAFGIMIFSGLLMFFVGLFAYKAKEASNNSVVIGNSPTELQKLYSKSNELNLHGFEPIYGNADAPYMIVIFADYQCPYCSIASDWTKKYVSKNADVQLRYKHYPISNQCNKHVSHNGHPTACAAALAVECAKTQGSFWELSDLLYKNQRYQSKEDIRFMARQIQLDMDLFEQCMEDNNSVVTIAQDADEAIDVELTGTPAIYLKGILGDEWVKIALPAENIETLISAHRNGVQLLRALEEQP